MTSGNYFVGPLLPPSRQHQEKQVSHEMSTRDSPALPLDTGATSASFEV
jgi:hypothetical protein